MNLQEKFVELANIPKNFDINDIVHIIKSVDDMNIYMITSAYVLECTKDSNIKTYKVQSIHTKEILTSNDGILLSSEDLITLTTFMKGKLIIVPSPLLKAQEIVKSI